MSKWSFVAILLLSICMAGCMGDSGGRSHSDTGSQNENAGIAGDTQSFAGGNIDEKIDENLYVQAEFHMPEQELFTYSSKLKKFDDKVQSVFWKNADAGKIKKDEFGGRYYGGAELGIGGDDGVMIYRANKDINYIETLCSYAKDESIIPEKNLKFATAEQAGAEVKRLVSKLGIGCELGKPSVTALNNRDLSEVQKKIMEDDIGDILRAKKTGNKKFDSSMEVYYFEYPFVLNQIRVFGNDEPPIRLSGDEPLPAQAMNLTAIVSKSGIEELMVSGALDKLSAASGKAEIMGYDGIKRALEKKFGDVILKETYKVTNIWMEYFPLIKPDSFNQVNVTPVWCCDFEIGGKKQDYTLRFNAVTGEEIA